MFRQWDLDLVTQNDSGVYVISVGDESARMEVSVGSRLKRMRPFLPFIPDASRLPLMKSSPQKSDA